MQCLQVRIKQKLILLAWVNLNTYISKCVYIEEIKEGRENEKEGLEGEGLSVYIEVDAIRSLVGSTKEDFARQKHPC